MTKLTFKTRDGLDAVITGWMGGTTYPIRGGLRSQPATTYCWTVDGHYWKDLRNEKIDLIITAEEVAAISKHFTKGRKKARIAELEAQVAELQARLRQVAELAGEVK